MAAEDVASILRVPASLIWNPTNLGAPATNYGGTVLGISREKEFTPQPVLRPIWNETAGAYKDVIYCGERVLFRAVLRYPDSDAVTAIMPRSIASGSSGVHWLFRPEGTTSNTRAGTSLGTMSGVLLVAARARVDHPMLLIYNAIPSIDESLKLQWSLGKEFGLAVAFWGTPSSNGRCYDCGRRANLAL